MRHCLALLLLLTTAGCTAGPDYAGPAAEAPPAPARFIRGASGGDIEQPAVTPWWTSLNDPLLDRLVDRALAGNADLDAAAARIRQARASLRERRAANLPAINASVLAAKVRLPGQADDGGISNLTLYNLGFDSSWELDLFGGQRRGVEAARAEAESREASLADAQVSLSAEVAQTYVDLRERQQQVALGEQGLALYEQQIALANQRFQAGTVGRDAPARARMQRDDARAMLAPVRAEIDAYKDKLAMLTGTVPGSLDAELDLPAAIPLPPAQVAIGDPAALLQRRPDIRAAERTLAAQSARIGVAEAARFPGISFLGLFGLGGSNPSDLFDLDQITVAAVPRLSWTLFDFGRSKARVNGAQAQRDEAAARYRATVLAALQDAEGSLARFARSRESLADRAHAERQANETAELARQRQAAGTIAMSDYLSVRQTVLNAAGTRQQAAAATTSAFIAVEKALGLGWQGLSEAPSTSK